MLLALLLINQRRSSFGALVVVVANSVGEIESDETFYAATPLQSDLAKRLPSAADAGASLLTQDLAKRLPSAADAGSSLLTQILYTHLTIERITYVCYLADDV